MKRIALAACLLVGVAHAQPATMQPDDRPAPQHDSMQPLGEGVHIQPIVVPQDPPRKDLRPVYMGVGLLLIAAAFWWNRRQREKFDKTDEDKA